MNAVNPGDPNAPHFNAGAEFTEAPGESDDLGAQASSPGTALLLQGVEGMGHVP